MRKTIIKLIVCAQTLFLCSCAHNPCNPAVALRAGQNDAAGWTNAAPATKHGGRCGEDYGAAAYEKDYLSGFHTGLSEACSTRTIEDFATSAAHNFNPQETEFLVQHCKSARGAVEQYRKAYQAGKKQVCSNEFIREKAHAHAENGENFVDRVRTFCSAAAAEVYQAALDMAAIKVEMKRTREELQAQRQELLLQRQQMNQQVSGRRHTNRFGNISAHCYLDNSSHRAIVTVHNDGKETFHGSTNWNIKFYNQRGRRISDTNEMEILILMPGSSDDFDTTGVPGEATSCAAFYQR